MSYVENSEVALTAGAIVLRLVAVLVIVLANAFFVAAELSLVSARRSRIDALAARGDRSAKLVQETANDIPRYLSAMQLGVTLASLALGWAGEATVASLIAALFAAARVRLGRRGLARGGNGHHRLRHDHLSAHRDRRAGAEVDRVRESRADEPMARAAAALVREGRAAVRPGCSMAPRTRFSGCSA